VLHTCFFASAVSWSLLDNQRDDFFMAGKLDLFSSLMVLMDTSEIEFGNCKTYCLGCHRGPIGEILIDCGKICNATRAWI
jgi:hypothetical protein